MWNQNANLEMMLNYIKTIPDTRGSPNTAADIINALVTQWKNSSDPDKNFEDLLEAIKDTVMGCLSNSARKRISFQRPDGCPDDKAARLRELEGLINTRIKTRTEDLRLKANKLIKKTTKAC